MGGQFAEHFGNLIALKPEIELMPVCSRGRCVYLENNWKGGGWWSQSKRACSARC